jgi:hypothetical protein
MKKYILAKDLPDHPAGTELQNSNNTWYTPKTLESVSTVFNESDLQRAIETGWVKEVEDRVFLFSNPRTVWKRDGVQFTPEEITLMEKALNGELLDIDLAVFTDWVFDAEPGNMTHSELLEAFNDRHRR